MPRGAALPCPLAQVRRPISLRMRMVESQPVVQALGIGGLFFRSKDPERLAQWYRSTFGIIPPGNGPPWHTQAGYTVFSPFEASTDYFGSPRQGHMVNFRIADLDAAVSALARAGVPLVKPIEEMEGIGRFAWVEDPEGNRIELWQPTGAAVDDPAP